MQHVLSWWGSRRAEEVDGVRWESASLPLCWGGGQEKAGEDLWVLRYWALSKDGLCGPWGKPVNLVL